jgi:hypothetical protein
MKINEVLTVPGGRLSVRELIRLLRKCPDQDAFVLPRMPIPRGIIEDVTMIDGLRPKPGSEVELIGEKGW